MSFLHRDNMCFMANRTLFINFSLNPHIEYIRTAYFLGFTKKEIRCGRGIKTKPHILSSTTQKHTTHTRPQWLRHFYCNSRSGCDTFEEVLRALYVPNCALTTFADRRLWCVRVYAKSIFGADMCIILVYVVLANAGSVRHLQHI